MDAVGDQLALELLDPAGDRAGDVGGVAAGFLGDGNRDRRGEPRHGAGAAGGRAVPGVAGGDVGAGAHVGDIAQAQRAAAIEADHEVGDRIGIDQELPGRDRHRALGADALTDLTHRVRGLQRLRQVGHGQAIGGEFARVQRHRDHALRRADRVHVATAADALNLGFQRVRDLGQFGRAALRVVGPQRDAHHRHVVDALGLDQRLAHADARRQPVLVRKHLVVQAHDRRLALDADGELDGQHRHARTAGRIDVLDALDFRQLLLQRRAHELLDVARAGTDERHEHVRHRHVDLRLFLPRGDQHRDQAQQQAQQREHRGQRIGLERGGEAAGQPQARDRRGVTHGRLRQRPGAARSRPAARRPNRWRPCRRPSVRRSPRPARRCAGRDGPGAARGGRRRARTRR